MNIVINNKEYNLETIYTYQRKLISIGRKCDEVCNAIEIDDDAFDIFQCQISKNGNDEWQIHNGQYRTECPKGLKSARDKACSMCMSVCVSISIANPTYSWRIPERATLLNGEMFDEYAPLHEGDVISVGE